MLIIIEPIIDGKFWDEICLTQNRDRRGRREKQQLRLKSWNNKVAKDESVPEALLVKLSNFLLDQIALESFPLIIFL